jgi:hypothetical protein
VRALLLVVLLVLSTATAHAQKVAVAGKPLLLAQLAEINPDCSSLGHVEIRTVSPASHGSVSFKRGGIFATFAAPNRSHCNRRRVQGVTAVYVARRGYTGSDSVTLEFLGSSGRYDRRTFNILVR